MKSLFLSIIIIFTCIAMANAVPAQPGWSTFIQSDGKTVTLELVGDEWSSATLTRDGLMVTRDKDGDFYYYSSLTGRTAVRAHDIEHRTAVEAAFIEAQRLQLKYEYKRHDIAEKSMRFSVPFRAGGLDNSCPAEGDREIPVILVNFKNRSFSHTKYELVNSMLLGDKGVYKYFRDQSNNKYRPRFEVLGPYTLSEDYEYYGAPYTDEAGKEHKDIHPREMAREAIDLARAQGVDFSRFSNYVIDGSDQPFLDAVIIIYAGYGQASGSGADKNTIWPHRWILTNPEESYYYSVDGVYAWQYGMFNELDGTSGNIISGIGTFCHEFSHCLGLPDFYDTEDQSRHYGMGRWSLMCSGQWNDGGFTPIGYNAYEKHFMGWLDYTNAVPGTYYTLPVLNKGNDKAVCVSSEVNSNEYFLYEYRKKQEWDQFIKGEGIMVTHVSFAPNRWIDGNVNNQDIQLMTILPADDNLSLNDEDKDLWPKKGKNELTDDTSPSTKLYLNNGGTVTGNAGFLGKPVTDMVINSNGTASFWFMKDYGNRLSSSTSMLDFGRVKCNTKKTMTISISGENLTNDITLTITGKNKDKFSVDKTTIPVAPVCTNEGYTFTVTYTALKLDIALITHEATLNIRSGDQYLDVALKGKSSVFGDENGDGKFNIDDVSSVIDYMLVNQDSPYSGELSIADLSTMIDYLLNGETTVDLEDGLVAYYPLDGDARDMSGNGNHGITTNVTATTGVTGTQNGAYRFGGTANSGYIRVPNSPSLQFNDGFTFSCFVKPMDWKGMNGTGSIVENGSHCIFAKSSDRTGPAMMFSGNDDGLHVWCGATGDQCQWANIGSSDLLNNGNYLNHWVHVAVSYSYSKRRARLYVNGNLIQEKFLMTPVDYSLMNASDLYLGRFKTTSWWNPMNGVLDEVRIYNRALGVPEVKELAGQFITDAQVGLSESVVVMAVGEEVYVDIKNGCGNYSVGSCPDVVDCRLEGESIILTGMGEGTTNVTFIDIDSHTTIQLPVTVVNASTVYTVNGVSFTMVPVLGGTFTMGATNEQGTDAADNEKPTHLVTLSNYSIGQTEVTQALWQAVMGSNPSMFTGDLHRPVENVSWNDCQSFITKLNGLTGLHFRLPTEAEWEYAARGDGVSQGYKYSGGNKISEVAWWGCGYDETSTAGNSAYTTHPVGLKIANELSLYDMSGNVYEWCQDWYGTYSSAAQVNPQGPASGTNRVTRGGGWGYGNTNCRVSHRMSCSPTYRHPAIGLRLAL